MIVVVIQKIGVGMSKEIVIDEYTFRLDRMSSGERNDCQNDSCSQAYHTYHCAPFSQVLTRIKCLQFPHVLCRLLIPICRRFSMRVFERLDVSND
jgi:hypothetical protein